VEQETGKTPQKVFDAGQFKLPWSISDYLKFHGNNIPDTQNYKPQKQEETKKQGKIPDKRDNKKEYKSTRGSLTVYPFYGITSLDSIASDPNKVTFDGNITGFGVELRGETEKVTKSGFLTMADTYLTYSQANVSNIESTNPNVTLKGGYDIENVSASVIFGAGYQCKNFSLQALGRSTINTTQNDGFIDKDNGYSSTTSIVDDHVQYNSVQAGFGIGYRKNGNKLNLRAFSGHGNLDAGIDFKTNNKSAEISYLYKNKFEIKYLYENVKGKNNDERYPVAPELNVISHTGFLDYYIGKSSIGIGYNETTYYTGLDEDKSRLVTLRLGYHF